MTNSWGALLQHPAISAKSVSSKLFCRIWQISEQLQCM